MAARFEIYKRYCDREDIVGWANKYNATTLARALRDRFLCGRWYVQSDEFPLVTFGACQSIQPPPMTMSPS